MAIEKLATLSQRERQVLQLRCEGKDYKTISHELNIAVPTVKFDMGRVYIKLNLDTLGKTERLKVLLEDYCPILDNTALPPSPTGGDIQPVVPEEILALVVQDERNLVVATRPGPIVPTSTEVIYVADNQGPQRPARSNWGQLLIALLLGMVLMLGLFFLFRPSPGGTAAPQGQTPIIVSQVTVVVVTATPAPALPSASPVVQQVTVVVTAIPQPTSSVAQATVTSPPPSITPTSPPTLTPPPTPIQDTPAGSVLAPGDTWIQNGTSLRLTSYDLYPALIATNIGLIFEFTNNTSSDILLSVNKEDVAVTTNTGENLVSFGYRYCMGTAATVPAGQRLNMTDYCGSEQGHFWITADLTNSTWTSFTVHVLRFSSEISDARWKIALQR